MSSSKSRRKRAGAQRTASAHISVRTAAPVPLTDSADVVRDLEERLSALERNAGEHGSSKAGELRLKRWTMVVSVFAVLISATSGYIAYWAAGMKARDQTVQIEIPSFWKTTRLAEHDNELVLCFRISNKGPSVTIESVLLHTEGRDKNGFGRLEELSGFPKTLGAFTDGTNVSASIGGKEPKTITVVTTGGATFTFRVPPVETLGRGPPSWR